MTQETVTLNDEQQLYVIPSWRHDKKKDTYKVSGYSCYGYDVLQKRVEKLFDYVKQIYPEKFLVTQEIPPRGTLDLYFFYHTLTVIVHMHYQETGIQCPIELLPQLIGLERKRVEVLDHDGNTRRFWVSRSTGWIPCHLEVARLSSSGGMAADSRGYQFVRVVREQ